MPPPSPPPAREPLGGGFLLVAALLAGTAVGFVVHQATIGFLVGGAIGGAALAALWWRQRG